MSLFISCDWGTSSFRLRLINAEDKSVLAETKSKQGIAATYALWKEQFSVGRKQFYIDFMMLQKHLLQTQCGYSLNDLVIIVSGMASSSIGMAELPYKPLPFYMGKGDFEILHIPASGANNRMIIISGVRSGNDVMRGEETILAGCNIPHTKEEQLFIFPGTHSKHVVIQNGMLVNIETYMTGELFELLSTKSILADSVEANDEMNLYKNFYENGIRECVQDNFLHSIFYTRSKYLFGQLNKRENYHYLSGLLLGEELKLLANRKYGSITIVSEGALLKLYSVALSILGLEDKLVQKNADEALINGQLFIFNQSINLPK